MQAPLDHSAEEIKRLQRCVNDLVSMLALPAIWTGAEPSQVVSALLDMLVGMLRLDFAYVRLNSTYGDVPLEMVRGTQSRTLKVPSREISEFLNGWFRDNPEQWPDLLRSRIGEEDISFMPLRIGVHGDIGVVVAGSRRSGFPEQTERLVLSVAANQAAIGLQEARLLSDQKRVASELDRRVAKRTRELAETNAELQLQVGLLQHLPVSAWTLKPDGTPDFVNRVWLDYSGQTLDFVRSHPEAWMTALHPEDRETASRAFWEGVRSGQGFAMECRSLRARDGAYRWHLLQAVVLRDAEGKVLKFVGTTTDIEDVKRSQQELRRGEARKTAILNSSLDCIVTIDHEACITEFNPAAEQTFGYRRDEVLGKQLADVIIPPSLREQHRQGFARYLATGEARVLGRRVEMTAARADGREFPVELSISRIPMEGPPSFTGYLRDITERKRAEVELRRSEAFLAQGQRLSLTGTFLWRLDKDEITFSEQLYRIFEFEPNRLVTFEQIGTRVHPDDIPMWTEKVDLARREINDHDYEIRLRMPDGSIKYLRTKSWGTRGQDGRLELIGAIQDVTERRLSDETLSKVRSELAQMTRATSLGALTASIAHEVNQPLSGIVTNASTCVRMLSSDPPDVDGALETARRTIRDGNRASEVITRLRALFSKKEITIEPVDLNEASREVIALSLSDLQRNRVSLRTELVEDLPLVMGDRVQLQQVILNLLRNASDSMSDVDGRTRQLVIKTDRHVDDSVRLTLQDTGIGIDPKNMERLFDPFYTTKSSGMGMGLSVSRSIIEGHRGNLLATVNDGPGATFAFSIPRAPDGTMGTGNLSSIQASALTDTQNDTRNP
jgi:PAS domain S-box-containing protein